MKLLVTDKKFQERVKEIRKYIELPENGIDTDTPNCNELSEAWHREFYRRSDKMMDSPEFLQKERKLKKLFNDKKIDYLEYKKLIGELYSKIPINYLDEQCKNLTTEFNVPLNCEQSLYLYILYNDLIRPPTTPFSISTGSSKDRNERAVSLIFYAKITDADLKFVKNTVNDLFDKLPKINPVKDIDIKLAIEKSQQNREGFDHVSNKKYRIPAKEIAEVLSEDMKKKIKVSDIYEVPRELKILRNKRFRKSGKK